MDSLAIVVANLTQFAPGLLASLGALGWFALRPAQAPRPSVWWGALAGFVVLAVPSVMGHVIQFVALGRSSPDQRLTIMLSTLPSAVIWFLLTLGGLLACLLQRQDLLRRAFAAAVLFGVVLREIVLLIVALGAALTGFGS